MAWLAILNRTFKVQKVYWPGLEFQYFNKTFNMLRANELCRPAVPVIHRVTALHKL